jgi:hypothetical protein
VVDEMRDVAAGSRVETNQILSSWRGDGARLEQCGLDGAPAKSPGCSGAPADLREGQGDAVVQDEKKGMG